MRESKKFSVENLKFDWLMSFLDEQFQQFSDIEPVCSLTRNRFYSVDGLHH